MAKKTRTEGESQPEHAEPDGTEAEREPIPFDDALRIILAAPPQRKTESKSVKKPRKKKHDCPMA